MEYKYANTTYCHCPQHKLCRLLFCSNFTVALQIILIETGYLIVSEEMA